MEANQTFDALTALTFTDNALILRQLLQVRINYIKETVMILVQLGERLSIQADSRTGSGDKCSNNIFKWA